GAVLDAVVQDSGGQRLGGQVLGVGNPVSARFSKVENRKILLIGTRKGMLLTLAGPKRRHCGLFRTLHTDDILSILDHLDYKSAK
ncbi:unnamed protein product, partial [Discosporangium mesarthrocarpum]